MSFATHSIKRASFALTTLSALFVSGCASVVTPDDTNTASSFKTDKERLKAWWADRPGGPDSFDPADINSVLKANPSAGASHEPRIGSGYEVLLQGFHWNSSRSGFS